MADKIKKVDREFCLTDASVNVYGFRLLTDGCLIDEFKKNPIGFLMHDRDKGVVCRWEDFRQEGDKIYAKPVINLSHPKGQETLDSVENGFINAASVGKIVCLDASDDKELMIEGQTGLTITEWYPREVSLVDIPGNKNALANLFDEDGNAISLEDLSDKVKSKNRDMSKLIITAAMLAAINLDDKADEATVASKIKDLADLAAKVPQLEKDLSDKTTELKNKEKELQDLQSLTVKEKVADLIAKGKQDKKLTNEVASKLEKTYANDPDGLKDLIDAMPAQVEVAGATGGDVKDLASFEGKSWDELYASNQLETVRTKFPDLYEKLKKEKYPNL